MGFRYQRFSCSGPINRLITGQPNVKYYASCAAVRSNLGQASGYDAIIVGNRGTFVKTNGTGTDSGTELTTWIQGSGVWGFQFESRSFAAFSYRGDPAYREGTVFWDGNSWNCMTEFSDVTLQLGEESQILVVNDTSGTAANGAVAYASGAQGQRLATALFANGTSNAGKVLGLYTHTVAAHQNGRMTNFGLVRELNTQGMTVGNPVYSSGVAGQFTQTRPLGTVEGVEIGLVVQAHPTNGAIFVRVQLLKRQIGTTANRPTNPREGDMFVDSTLNKPIWWNGSVWIDATGATV